MDPSLQAGPYSPILFLFRLLEGAGYAYSYDIFRCKGGQPLAILYKKRTDPLANVVEDGPLQTISYSGFFETYLFNLTRFSNRSFSFSIAVSLPKTHR